MVEEELILHQNFEDSWPVRFIEESTFHKAEEFSVGIFSFEGEHDN